MSEATQGEIDAVVDSMSFALMEESVQIEHDYETAVSTAKLAIDRDDDNSVTIPIGVMRVAIRE